MPPVAIRESRLPRCPRRTAPTAHDFFPTSCEQVPLWSAADDQSYMLSYLTLANKPGLKTSFFTRYFHSFHPLAHKIGGWGGGYLRQPPRIDLAQANLRVLSCLRTLLHSLHALCGFHLLWFQCDADSFAKTGGYARCQETKCSLQVTAPKSRATALRRGVLFSIFYFLFSIFCFRIAPLRLPLVSFFSAICVYLCSSVVPTHFLFSIFEFPVFYFLFSIFGVATLWKL